MRRYFLTLILSLSMTGLVFADTGSLKPYQAGDWKSIIKATNGGPVAVNFWGVTCPSCVKEMPQWGSFLKRNPTAKVIFIQVDDVSIESIKKMLSKADLGNANNYYVAAPFDEHLRYEIDPKWHGETPTTIVIDKNGKVTRKTGLVDFQQLQNTFIVKP